MTTARARTPNSETSLPEIIAEAEEVLRREIERRRIRTASRADELAAEIAGRFAKRYGFGRDSDNEEAILVALYRISGPVHPSDSASFPREVVSSERG